MNSNRLTKIKTNDETDIRVYEYKVQTIRYINKNDGQIHGSRQTKIHVNNTKDRLSDG